jgi:hypothetical protein
LKEIYMVMQHRFGEGLAQAAAPVVVPMATTALVTAKTAALGAIVSNPVGLAVVVTLAAVGAVGTVAAAIESQQNK